MLLCSARFLTPPETDAPPAPETVEVTTPDGTIRRADDPELIPALQAGLGKQNRMWLTEDNDPFMECRPLALMSLATLAQLEAEMAQPVAPERFRENVLLDLPGLPGFAEDGFVGRTVRIGEAEIVVKERDPRCRIITVDPATGALLPDLMKLVAREHESRAGIYGVAVKPGWIAEGDPVCLM